MRFAYLLSACPFLLAATGSAFAAQLSAGSQTRYVIVTAGDAIAPEQTAARELQSFLQDVTGATFQIMDEAEAPEDAPKIVVGPTHGFKAAFPEIDLAALKHDGIVMKTTGDDIYLAGGRPRGTIYAVYTFLEDTVGVRWWGSRPDETFIPDRPTLDVPALDTVYVPKLQSREAFYRGAFEGVYAARSKCNGHFERIPPEYGGHYNLLGWCHTFNQLLPPEKYFKDHPEWYSLINGKRTHENAQLCLTNDEMRAELTKNALEWIRKDPDAGMISIAQNDCAGPCQCEACRKIVEEEGAESGGIITFVNQVAEDIEKEYPDFLVETLAYWYTRQAPRNVKPRHNVLVRLCSIECSFAQPLGTGPQNEKFARDMKQWSAIAPQLYIWDYVTVFGNYIQPHPNFRVLAPNIRFFVDNKAIGLFEQGDAGCSCSCFPELRAWLLSHLMWDPSRDDRALIEEFMHGYYGAAAEPLLQYIDLICDAVEEAGFYLGCFVGDTGGWMTPEVMQRATELFNEAAAKVQDDPGLTVRVRRARMPLDHTWLLRYHGLKRLAQLQGKPFLGPADPRQACEAFISAAHEFEANSHREGGSFADYEPMLRGRFPAPGREPSVPAEAAGLTADQWFDIQQGEFWFAGLGNWVTLVDDADASDGKAARMPGSHNQWAVQYYIPGDLTALGKWRCYVVAKADVKAEAGTVMQIGLWDRDGAKGIATIGVQAEQARDGKYHTYDLGAHELRNGWYAWVAPMNDEKISEAVYVDRVFFVKEK